MNNNGLWLVESSADGDAWTFAAVTAGSPVAAKINTLHQFRSRLMRARVVVSASGKSAHQRGMVGLGDSAASIRIVPHADAIVFIPFLSMHTYTLRINTESPGYP